MTIVCQGRTMSRVARRRPEAAEIADITIMG